MPSATLGAAFGFGASGRAAGSCAGRLCDGASLGNCDRRAQPFPHLRQEQRHFVCPLAPDGSVVAGSAACFLRFQRRLALLRAHWALGRVVMLRGLLQRRRSSGSLAFFFSGVAKTAIYAGGDLSTATGTAGSGGGASSAASLAPTGAVATASFCAGAPSSASIAFVSSCGTSGDSGASAIKASSAASGGFALLTRQPLHTLGQLYPHVQRLQPCDGRSEHRTNGGCTFHQRSQNSKADAKHVLGMDPGKSPQAGCSAVCCSIPPRHGGRIRTARTGCDHTMLEVRNPGHNSCGRTYWSIWENLNWKFFAGKGGPRACRVEPANAECNTGDEGTCGVYACSCCLAPRLGGYTVMWRKRTQAMPAHLRKTN